MVAGAVVRGVFIAVGILIAIAAFSLWFWIG